MEQVDKQEHLNKLNANLLKLNAKILPSNYVFQNIGDQGLSDNSLKQEVFLEENTITTNVMEIQDNKSCLWALKEKINNMMLKSCYDIFLTVITLYILYADDVRLLCDNCNDNLFFSISFACVIIFLTEIIILSVVRQGYIWSFFFWMDLLATMSTVMDIPWLMDDFGLSLITGQTNFSKVNKAGKASRISSRATKIIRIIRLLRIIRITKLYRYAQQSIQEKFKAILNEDKSNTKVSLCIDDSEVFENEIEKKDQQSVLDISPILDPQFSMKKMINFKRNSTPINYTYQDQKFVFDQQQMLRVSLFSQQRQDTLIEDDPIMSLEPSNRQLIQNQNYALLDRKSIIHQKRLSNIMSQNPIKVIDSTGLFETQIKEEKDQFEEMQETNVGKRLSDLTTKKAILLMLSIIFSIPIFDYGTYWNSITSYDTGLQLLLQQHRLQDDNKFLLNNFLDFSQSYSPRTPIIYIELDGQQVYLSQQDLSLYRPEELTFYSISDANLVLLQKEDSQLNAILGLAVTTFIITIMVSGALLFSKDSTNLVVVPIENMISKVKRIANNPLEAAKMEEDQEMLEQELYRKSNSKKWNDYMKQNTYETVVLQRLIIKTGGLLAIGFGEAGGAIIAENMRKGNAVNPMIQGRKIVAIFGFCDIRNFTDMTEILQEQVMLFVNDIALIVHSNVHNNHGSANKNIGDAFLLVWRIPDSILSLVHNEEYSIKNIHAVNNFADLALYSFVKIMVQIQKSSRLDEICKQPNVTDRLPGYSVKLGYGLHLGWAIEGAIGSNFKIDASYLSPHVNMASRLEAATKQYGASILFSGQFYHFLSKQVKDMTRYIDRITVKGSIIPIDLFTYDTDISLLSVDHTVHQKSSNEKLLKYIKRKKLKEQYQKIITNRFKIHNHFTNDVDIKIIRQPFTEKFFTIYDLGMECYIFGRWQKAIQYFEDVKDIFQNDGPSQALIDYIKRQNGVPKGWQGFRELTDKQINIFQIQDENSRVSK